MNDTWYNLTIPRHLNEKQKAYFWNHAQDHRLCGKNHRAGGPFDRSSPLSTSPTLRRANRIGTILYPLAIENPLSQEQVTAVQNRKHVLAPPRILLKSRTPIKVLSGWMNLISVPWAIHWPPVGVLCYYQHIKRCRRIHSIYWVYALSHQGIVHWSH